MSQLLGDEILLVKDDRLPFSSNGFDRVIAIGAHAHLPYIQRFMRGSESDIRMI